MTLNIVMLVLGGLALLLLLLAAFSRRTARRIEALVEGGHMLPVTQADVTARFIEDLGARLALAS